MTETEEQKIFVGWFRAEFPEYRHCLRVSLAGLNLGGGRRAAIMVNHIRALGIEDSESDIVLSLGRGCYHSLVIEHKAAGSTHKLNNEQEKYLKKHEEVGNCAVSTRGVEALKAAVTAYISL